MPLSIPWLVRELLALAVLIACVALVAEWVLP